jgi:GNAT superfamily N-acetyltransferase
MEPPITIHPATPADVPAIFAMICELADFERLRHEIESSEEDLHRALFAERPVAETIVARVGDETAAFALFFPSYSTFAGKSGIYLEDLYVRPQFRGRGVGKRLLLEVGRLAFERGCARYEWVVLDWNERALEFYRSCGAELHGDWRRMRVSGEALEKMAQLAS